MKLTQEQMKQIINEDLNALFLANQMRHNKMDELISGYEVQSVK